LSSWSVSKPNSENLSIRLIQFPSFQ
jgi:hypothetical protein